MASSSIKVNLFGRACSEERQPAGPPARRVHRSGIAPLDRVSERGGIRWSAIDAMDRIGERSRTTNRNVTVVLVCFARRSGRNDSRECRIESVFHAPCYGGAVLTITIFPIAGNDGLDLQLNLLGEMVQFGGPRMAATGALHHDDGETSHDDYAAVVMTLRTLNPEGPIRIGHGRAGS